jgi:transcriptional regulator with XRE-family HTH domain
MSERLNHIESPPQPGHISEFENGRREPSLLFLLAVARLAGVSLEILLDDELDLPNRLADTSDFNLDIKPERGKKSR